MSTGQAVGAVVGGSIGFFLGGPTGAMYGAQIGIAAGGYLDPPKGPTQEGPRLSDTSQQTSTYGATIPRVYGTIGVLGNIFWLENNSLKEVVKKKKSGGKGGGSSATVKTYTYYGTFAVGLCEGPIAGVRRIWVGPDLIYNAGSDDLQTIIASNQAASGFTIYTGTEDQQPDPRMQAEMGVANCPAYRGLAYIVVKDLLLTNYGNSVAVAQVKVEVISVKNDQYPVLIDSVDELPAVGVFYSGKAGGYLEGFYFSASIAGTAHAYKLNSSGSSEVTSTFFDMTDWSAFNAMQSMDEHDLMFVNSTNGTQQLLFLDNDLFTVVETAFDLENTRYHERSGHSWVQFSYDYNNPEGSPSGSWIAKIDKQSVDGWTYPTKFAAEAVEVDRYVPTPDGYLIKYTSPNISGASTLDITAYDEFGAAAYSFVASLNSTVATKGSKRSAVFVDDSMVAHFVFMLYRPINPLPAEYGKVYYVKVDLTNQVILAQTEIFFPELVAVGHAHPQSCFEEDGIVYFGGAFQNGKNFYCAFPHAVISDAAVSLGSIVASEMELSALINQDDIVTSSLTESVTGYKVSKIGSIRNAIEPLRGAWPFDVVQSGYQIKVARRGRTSIATIPHGDLLMDSELEESREMDAQLPAIVQVKYLDQGRDYDANEQRSARNGDETVNTLALDLPVVLSATQAAQVSEKLLYIYWLERSDFSFKLPSPYRYLEPGDVVTVVTEYASYEFRISSVNYESDGSIACSAKANNAAAYTSIAEGDSGLTTPGTVPLAGATYAASLDIPVVDETLQNAPGFVVAMTGTTEGWPGGILYRTEDGGQTWTDLQAFAGKCVFGAAAAPLSVNACSLIQQGGSLTVELIAGELESVTEAQMLNGSNLCAYGANGRWEIMRFQNANLNGDGTYTLSTFWRGDKGTEWATGLHVAGDAFVLLTDPDNAFIGVSLDSIGSANTYRAVTAGASIDSASDIAFTYAGVNFECLSPVHPKGVRDGSNNMTATWQRRTRIGGAWRDYVDATLSETVEAYEVDVMDGATVVRTITSAAQFATYSAADQATDFGAPQSSITLRIYQMSDKVGRGYPLEATL